MNKNKMTKADLKTLLEGYKDAISDKSLKERISYTLKKYGESTKKTVLDLIEDIEASLTPAPLPVENSTKPTLKKSTGKKNTSKKSEPEEEPTEDSGDKSEEKPKSTPKKSSGKAKTKLVAPKKVSGATEASYAMAAIFPKEIEDENIGKMIAVPDKYFKISELNKAIMEEGKTIVIAMYFPVPMIKKFGYALDATVDKRVPKKGFAHDLDIQQVIYCCEGIDRAYALSDYTEGMFFVDEEMLTPVETVDSTTGDTVMTRFANGAEFELYEVITDEE